MEQAYQQGYQNKLYLDQVTPLWQCKLSDLVTETEFDRILRSEINLPVTSGSEDAVSFRRAQAQDVFNAVVIRQRRVQ